MFVPLLLDRVWVKDRPEVFTVFRIDRAQQTADLFCLGPEIIERGVHWTMLEAVGDDEASWLLARLVSQQQPAVPHSCG